MAFPIDDDAFCSRVLEHDDPVDEHTAYSRFLAQRSSRSSWPAFAAGFVVAAAALAFAFVLTPLGTYARDFLTIFEPKQLVPIDVSSLATGHEKLQFQLGDFGTVKEEPMHARKLPPSADVDRAVGYHVLKPSYLPSDLRSSVGYEASPRVNDAFTFSASKARATEARAAHPLPPMPAALDGTTVTAQLGPFVEQRWSGDEPALLIEQMPVPVVRSSGATLAQLEKYLLAMPDVSPQFAAEIRGFANPASTLPVPFRADKQSAQRVHVHGVQGLAIGDNTGVGAAVMWQTNGMLYIVGGPQSEDEILKIADGLR